MAGKQPHVSRQSPFGVPSHIDVYNVTSHINDSHVTPGLYVENYGYYDGYYDYVFDDHFYEIFEFETPIYGYIWPVLVLFTTFCNLIVIGGFLRKHMRNATSLILVFIAVSDSLTGLVTLPATFHIFTGHNYALSKDWCNFAMITRLFISRAFHTISVWETLLLGCHRFLHIRFPKIAKKFCTIPVTIIVTVGIYLASFGLHIFHAFDIKAKDGFCHWTIRKSCDWACIYMWLTLLFSHFLPSLFLCGFAVNMIRTLNTFRHQPVMNSHTRRRKEKQRNFTIVVILIVVIFLVPELPYGIFYLVTLSLNHAGKRIFPFRTNRLIHCIYEILLVVSFHLNFWVYCVMIRSFRSCVKSVLRLLTCRPAEFERLDEEVTKTSGDELELARFTTATDSDQN